MVTQKKYYVAPAIEWHELKSIDLLAGTELRSSGTVEIHDQLSGVGGNLDGVLTPPDVDENNTGIW